MAENNSATSLQTIVVLQHSRPVWTAPVSLHFSQQYTLQHVAAKVIYKLYHSSRLVTAARVKVCLHLDCPLMFSLAECDVFVQREIASEPFFRLRDVIELIGYHWYCVFCFKVTDSINNIMYILSKNISELFSRYDLEAVDFRVSVCSDSLTEIWRMKTISQNPFNLLVSNAVASL